MVQVLDLPARFTVRNLPLHLAALESLHSGRESQTHKARSKHIVFSIGATVLALPMDRIQHIPRRVDLKRALRRTELSDSTLEWNGHLLPVVKTSRLLKLEGSADPSFVLMCRIQQFLLGFEFDELRSIVSAAQREKTAKKVAESILAFRMGKLPGLPSREVCEIVPARDTLKRMPDTPPAFLGRINLRGAGIPVVDPRVLLRWMLRCRVKRRRCSSFRLDLAARE